MTAPVQQERALATRAKILDAAVDLFDRVGYGETSLVQVIDLAGVTKGSFYYHFDAKVDLAAAIISESSRRIQAAIRKGNAGAAPALERMIRATFITSDVIQSDRLTHVGYLLAQSLSQVSRAGSGMYLNWTPAFVAGLADAAAEGDMRDDVDPAQAGEAIWISVVGCHLLSDALDDDRIARLVLVWRTQLPAIVPAEKRPYFDEFLSRLALHYRQPGETGPAG